MPARSCVWPHFAPSLSLASTRPPAVILAFALARAHVVYPSPSLETSPDELKRNCVGQPDEVTLMHRLVFDNKFPCATTLECRFWDENLAEWSNEGCATRVYNGSDGDSFVGCETSHLTDFVAVQVPTEAYGDIHFGVIDAATLRATDVQATYGGLWLTLHKRQDGATPLQSELRVAYTEVDGVPIGWELLNLTCPAASPAIADLRAVEPCEWLHPVAGAGLIFGNNTDECARSPCLSRKIPSF